MRSKAIRALTTFPWVLLAGTAWAVAEELTCVFQVTSDTVDAAAQAAPEAGQPNGVKATARHKIETRRTMIGLGPDYVTATHEGETTLAYHFPSRRMYVVDWREKTYADLSLYGLVASRVNELVRRRSVINEAVPAAFIDNAAIPSRADQFTVESLLSLRLPDDSRRRDSPRATVVHRGKEWEFDHGGRRFVRFVASDHPVPEAYRKSWSRFLTIQCSIHPTVRVQIIRAGVFPDVLQFSYFDITKSCTVTHRLDSIHEGPSRWAGVPSGFRPKVATNDRLGVVLTRLSQNKNQDALRTTPIADKFISDALSRPDALDAYLGWTEFDALGGDDPEHRSAKKRLLAKVLAANDRRVSSLRIERGEPEEMQAILKRIDGIDRAGLTKGYQLDVMRAFILIRLGRIGEADDCFLKALEANSQLLNCYRRLGDDRLRASDAVEAWRCFDAIRRVDPGDSRLKDVKELETRLESDFPEDF